MQHIYNAEFTLAFNTEQILTWQNIFIYRFNNIKYNHNATHLIVIKQERN